MNWTIEEHILHIQLSGMSLEDAYLRFRKKAAEQLVYWASYTSPVPGESGHILSHLLIFLKLRMSCKFPELRQFSM